MIDIKDFTEHQRHLFIEALRALILSLAEEMSSEKDLNSVVLIAQDIGDLDIMLSCFEEYCRELEKDDLA